MKVKGVSSSVSYHTQCGTKVLHVRRTSHWIVLSYPYSDVTINTALGQGGASTRERPVHTPHVVMCVEVGEVPVLDTELYVAEWYPLPEENLIDPQIV
jgi:hypothetical protein